MDQKQQPGQVVEEHEHSQEGVVRVPDNTTGVAVGVLFRLASKIARVAKLGRARP